MGCEFLRTVRGRDGAEDERHDGPRHDPRPPVRRARELVVRPRRGLSYPPNPFGGRPRSLLTCKNPPGWHPAGDSPGSKEKSRCLAPVPLSPSCTHKTMEDEGVRKRTCWLGPRSGGLGPSLKRWDCPGSIVRVQGDCGRGRAPFNRDPFGLWQQNMFFPVRRMVVKKLKI